MRIHLIYTRKNGIDFDKDIHTREAELEVYKNIILPYTNQ